MEAQLVHAKALLSNGKRITELMSKRDELTSALGEVDEELGGLLANGQLSLQLDTSTRAKQKCRAEMPDGTLCGSTEHTKARHPK